MRRFLSLIILCVSIPALHAFGQSSAGQIHGTVTDPTGAIIPNAAVSITSPDGHTVATVKSSSSGTYQAGNIKPGTYIVLGNAQGFETAAPKAVTVAAGQNVQFDLTLQIQTVQQQVQVSSEASTVSTSPDSNANAIEIKGKDLDALSDDPDELQNELQALAGPAAGPNGGQIYIDGFTGGQLPPKSSIREIRINQNPFSAEFDRLGYGRIEILTKPGTDKLHGQLEARGNYSSFNAQNPILNSNLLPGEPPLQQPPYYSYNFNGSVGGPINDHTSYFFSVFNRNNQNESIIDALNPNLADQNPALTASLNEAITNPSSRLDVRPRFDFQLGAANTLTVQDDFFREVQTNSGLTPQTLPEQATNIHLLENELQVSDSIVLGKNIADDIRFQYRRMRTQNIPVSTLPSVTLSGSFTMGGNASGTTEDHQDDFEIQDYFTQAWRSHSLNYGTRVRTYRDANYTNGGTNGAYVFSSKENYFKANPTPQQYQITQVNNYVARTTLVDAALFYQDDWKINPRFTLGYGVRWETQNLINDHSDWAPRVIVAYALDHGGASKQPKTVLRAGYGWFYERFTVPNGPGGIPYILRAIHNNFVPLGSSQVPNQQVFTVTNPNFYNPNQPVINVGSSGNAAAPTGYSLAPHFKSAVDMQAAVGIDRQVTKAVTANVTYLYSRGIHQYLTNDISAAGLFPEQNVMSGTYPTSSITPPAENNLQFQSGGVYRQDQIIASLNARYRTFSIVSFYTYNNAKADTNSVTHMPSIASNPGFDYGRATFDIHNRFLIVGNVMAPWQFSFSPFLSVNSGTPYNITTGSDLTGNNHFNARPTFAASCSEANVVATSYGCLNPDPLPGEKIVPYNLGMGPSNVSMNLRVAKVIGFGPKIEGANGGGGPHGGPRGGRGGLGPGGLGGGGGNFFGRMNATVPRKYSLTLQAFAVNIFNHQNLAPPNGTMGSPFFGKSQALAGGFFGPPTAGNRSVFLEANLSF